MSTSQLRTFRRVLRQHIEVSFDEAELRVLCFDMGIDYENLDPGARKTKILALIGFCERNDRLPELLEELRRSKPHVEWPLIPGTAPSAAMPQVLLEPPPPPAEPRPFADDAFIASLQVPGGAELPDSHFYIERPGDTVLTRELAKPFGTIATIYAPRQTGKTSLMMRAVSRARKSGRRVAALSMQGRASQEFSSLDSFAYALLTQVFKLLGLSRATLDAAWHNDLGPLDVISQIFEEQLLTSDQPKLVLAIDEADRLLKTSFQSDFFGLLRSWYNARALNETWNRLDIVLSISTEPHLLIPDINQSPFNIGAFILLEDFDRSQVALLNERYLARLTEPQIDELMQLLGGHPYLTRQALYTLVADRMSWERLNSIATSETGPFGWHLRRYLDDLRPQTDLRRALCYLIEHGSCDDETAFYRLQQAGLVSGTRRSCVCRCGLYERYFREVLC